VTFQELITNLSDFWIKQGCILAQPYDVEVGAGTMNPNTFFRVLGQSPGGSSMWNHPDAPQMAVMGKTRIGCTCTIKCRLS